MRILAPLSLVLVAACVFAITISTLGTENVKSGPGEVAPVVGEDLPPLRPIGSAAQTAAR